MTGAYFRVKRGEKYHPVEVEYLSNEEREKLLGDKEKAFLIDLVNILCNSINILEGESASNKDN